MNQTATALVVYFCSGLAGGFALAYLLQAEKTKAIAWKRWTVAALALCGGYLFSGYMGSVAKSPELTSITKGASLGLLALAFLLSFLIGKHRWSDRQDQNQIPRAGS